MISQLALILWIVVSVGFFALLAPLRAFLLTYFIGYLILPVEMGGVGESVQGVIVITQSLRIDKVTACNIGAFLGTLFFAADRFSRFRFHWMDAAYGVVIVGEFLTSLVNGLGAKDGLSHAMDSLRQILPMLVLARLNVCSVADVYEVLRALVGATFVYAFLCMAECRLSPQSHRLVYGYFQHAFEQFVRYGHFRPVGFLRHALECAFLMGTGTAAAAWLWYKGLLKPLWGMVPAPVVVITCAIGLATTLTFSGYAACLAALAMFFVMTGVRSRWVLVILPAMAIVWMAGRSTGAIDASHLLDLAKYFDPSRQESLAYRLEAERVHFATLGDHMVLGKGPNNGLEKDAGGNLLRAVDSWWLITLVFYGVVGLVGWYFVWGASIIETVRRWGELTPDLRTVATAICVLLGAQYLDFLFNSFSSPFLLILNVGLVATLGAYRPVPWAASAAWGFEAADPAADGLAGGAVAP